MYGAVLWILIVIQMTFPRLPSYGLAVELRTRGSTIGEKSPWQETLSVYLGVGERYYVNGEQVARESLGARLRQELNHRSVWTVYFEADYDTLNMNAIYAMDTIQGFGGELVWITPRTREELQQKRNSAQ